MESLSNLAVAGGNTCQAVSPHPVFDAPALDQALEKNAAEVWEMLQRPGTRVFVAGTENLPGVVEQTMIKLAGSGREWLNVQNALKSDGLWSEALY